MRELFIDFETFYDPKQKYSLKHMTTLEYVMDERFKAHMASCAIDGEPIKNYTPEELKKLLATLDPQQTRLIAQNTKFDGLILTQHFGFVAAEYGDLKALSKILWNHDPASLEAIVQRIWPNDPKMKKGKELEISKGIYDLTPEQRKILAGYCDNDVFLLREAYNVLRRYVPEREFYLIHLITKAGAVPFAKLDRPLLKRYQQKLEDDYQQIIKASGLGERFLRSRIRFPQWLDQEHDVQLPTKITPTGQTSYIMSKTDLEFIQIKESRPDLNHIWEAKAATASTIERTRTARFVKVAELYNDTLPIPLNYSAAHTHRMGGADKLNLMNLPRNAQDDHPDGDLRPGVLRRAILAPEGYKIVVFDLSNIEARLLAWLSGHEVLLDIFRNKGDVYSWMAEKIYGYPVNKKDTPLERNVGKVTVLGLGYGMGVATFYKTMHIGPMGMDPIKLSYQECSNIVSTYRSSNYPVVDFWKLCDRFIVDMANPNIQPYEYKGLTIGFNYIKLPSGVALTYPDLRNEDGQWMYNKSSFLWGGTLAENITQALAQDLIKDNMYETSKIADSMGGRYLLQVHDELIHVIPDEHVEEFCKKAPAIMKTPPVWGPDLPLDCEGGYAQNYSK